MVPSPISTGMMALARGGSRHCDGAASLAVCGAERPRTPRANAAPAGALTLQVKTWEPFNNSDVNLVTPSSWNFALSPQLADLRFERLGGPGKLPFDITKFPSVIHAKARAVPARVT